MTTQLHFSTLPSIGRGYANALLRARRGLCEAHLFGWVGATRPVGADA